MVVFRTIKNDCPALESIGVIWIGEILISEFLRNDRGFHDRSIEEISSENFESSSRLQSRFKAANHIGVDDLSIPAVFAHGFAVCSDGILMDLSVADQFRNDSRDSPCVVVILAKVSPSWL